MLPIERHVLALAMRREQVRAWERAEREVVAKRNEATALLNEARIAFDGVAPDVLLDYALTLRAAEVDEDGLEVGHDAGGWSVRVVLKDGRFVVYRHGLSVDSFDNIRAAMLAAVSLCERLYAPTDEGSLFSLELP